MGAQTSLQHICELAADPVRPELSPSTPTPAAILGAALMLLQEGVVAARRIDREALGHVVRGRSGRLDPQQVTSVASVQLASARCAATLLDDLDVPDWRRELDERAGQIKPEDPLTAMLFASVGLGQCRRTADLASTLELARAAPPPVR